MAGSRIGGNSKLARRRVARCAQAWMPMGGTEELAQTTRTAHIGSLGVLREFRGRGLAKLLLQRAFAGYAERGLRGVQLGVDSTSPTGANHLYESVGMRPHRVIDAWALWLTAEVPAG